MGGVIRVVGLDGDDTLWHNEWVFSITQERFRALLAPHVEGELVDDCLLATERRNLASFGYGVKSFVLSMIETAIECTDGRVTAGDIAEIIAAGKAMLEHPVELLEGVEDAIDALGDRYRLVLVTKGDLFDQESKLARSGLAERFDSVEVVSEKDERTYRAVLARQEARPEEFVMVGNSLRSDVLPVVAIGARAVHVPYAITWALEHAEAGVEHDGRWWPLDSLTGLAPLLAELDRAA